ncbi:MAG: protein translocase subunit SecD [Bacilli bacterium]|nr:protein translocase subunit SecD [Bacilli bacterium]
MKTILIISSILLFIIGIMIFIIKNKKTKVILGTIEAALILFMSAYLCIPIFKNINYGLDLQGGFEVLYEIEALDGNELSEDMVYNTYKAILKRVDILGVNEPEISIEDNNKIRIALAGISNKEEAREVISSTAVLSFRDYNDNLLMNADVLRGNAKVVADRYGRPAISLPIKDTEKFYNVTNKVKDMEENIIVIWLDYEVGEDSYFKEKDNCGSLSNSKCLSAARVSEAFASDVIIEGNFTEEEAKSLVELINSGSLPTKLNEISSRTVEASYGEKSLNKTLLAGIIGIILVIIMLMILYRFSGFIAGVSLALYTMASFLVFYLIEGTLTLPGIAAMLLGIGMAVDASVITFERIKDELKIGKNIPVAVSLGNKESLSSILDANITTIIVAIILFIFGQSSIKGFATMLIINIVLTIIILVFLSKYVISLFSKSQVFNNKERLFIGLNKKKIKKEKEIRIPFKKIDFVKSSKKIIPITLIILIGGLIYSVVTDFNFAVDFTGGTSITLNTNEEITLQEYTIKKVNKNKDSTTIVIKEELTKDEIEKLSNKIEEEYNTSTDIFVVSDMVKKELIKNAIFALILASIGIVIYVSFRFKFNYAVAGIIALIHDVLITIIFFGIFKLEIDSIFIAAILTIIGYSINDTIVTFDMIRKNYKNKGEIKKEDLKEIVNNSVRLTFFRTIITTLTTIVPILCLIFIGSGEILTFNLALLVGFIAGVFSSIYISNGIWLILEKRRITKPKKEKKDDDEIEELKIKGINC